jgi:hypothetical protein
VSAMLCVRLSGWAYAAIQLPQQYQVGVLQRTVEPSGKEIKILDSRMSKSLSPQHHDHMLASELQAATKSIHTQGERRASLHLVRMIESVLTLFKHPYKPQTTNPQPKMPRSRSRSGSLDSLGRRRRAPPSHSHSRRRRSVSSSRSRSRSPSRSRRRDRRSRRRRSYSRSRSRSRSRSPVSRSRGRRSTSRSTSRRANDATR